MKTLDGSELTIQQVSTYLNIPLSSTYRKISKLEEFQIIKKTKVMRKLDGSDESFFTLIGFYLGKAWNKFYDQYSVVFDILAIIIVASTIMVIVFRHYKNKRT